MGRDCFSFLEGEAKVWYRGFLYSDHDLTTKEEFVKVTCMWFGSREDVVGYVEYVERFEKLKSLTSILNPLLPKSYYVSSFISGLKDDNRLTLKILRLTTMIHAFDQAKWQEKSSLEIKSKNIFISRMPSSFNGSRPPSNLFFLNLTYKEWFTSGEKNNICLKQSMNKGED
jgi:hypothetical protein